MKISMNETATAEGGYVGSRMATETLPKLVETDGIIGKSFGNHILTYRTILSNHVGKDLISSVGGCFIGSSNNWQWYSRNIDLMSDVNVFGGNVASSSNFDIGIDSRQYAIFQIKPEFINSYEGKTLSAYSLKNVMRAEGFASASNGMSGYVGASQVSDVRPRFLID